MQSTKKIKQKINLNNSKHKSVGGLSRFNNKPKNPPHKFDKSKDLPSNQIWLYGKHAIFSALEHKRRKLYQILATKNSALELDNFIKKHNLDDVKSLVQIVEIAQIDNLLGQNQIHQGIAARFTKLPTLTQNDLLEELYSLEKSQLPTLLLLDQLCDPQNIGTIIRSALSFGVKKIIFCEHGSPKESAAMCKSSVGAIEMVDLVVAINFNNLIEKLKKIGYWCVGLDGNSETTIDKVDFDHVAIVVGSEGDGIRSLVKKNCDVLAKIKIAENVESLNAATATSIALYELSKKKNEI